MNDFLKFAHKFGVEHTTVDSFNNEESRLQFCKGSAGKVFYKQLKARFPKLAIGYRCDIDITYAFQASVIDNIQKPEFKRNSIEELDVPGEYYHKHSIEPELLEINTANWHRGFWCHGIQLKGPILIYRIV